MIKVAYIDDNPALLRSTAEVLSLFDSVELLFVSTDAAMAIDRLRASAVLPDVILMDIEMKGMDGIEATEHIHRLFPGIKIVMHTVFDHDKKVFDAILAGACGYLLKDEKPTKLLAAIEDAHEGRSPMSPTIALKTLDFLRRLPPPAAAASPEDYALSEREMEVLQHVANGHNYHSVAEKMFISPNTVRKHIENIYAKLHVHSKMEAVNFARQNKWLA